MADAGTPDAGLGLYIHWPFCQSKCPYCDFNSHTADAIDEDRWLSAYLSEVARVAAETPDRVLTSVFLGGGTPSLMPPGMVGNILERAQALWRVSDTLEVTLEANPTSVEQARFRGFRSAGVNRVSLGIQSLRDEDLRRLGRMHSAAEALEALAVARATFDRVSFDLIYARQHQDVADWRLELAEALDLAPDHLSLYQLTIEPGTVFAARRARGVLPGLPGEDAGADMYEATQDLCDAAGLPAYEISNHARAGAESRHNLTCWRGGDYAGIGPGAHGRITRDGQRIATEAEHLPGRWLEGVETAGSGAVATTRLTPGEWAEEYLLMSLRLSEGADLARYAAIRGAPPAPDGIAELADLGLVRRTDRTLRATERGRPVLDAVLRTLLA